MISLDCFILLSIFSVLLVYSVYPVKAPGEELPARGILALWLGPLGILICHSSFDWLLLYCSKFFLLLSRVPFLLGTKAALNLFCPIKY